MNGLSLRHLSGPHAGETSLIVGLPASIGSDPGLEIVVPGAAPRHAELILRRGQLVLRDLGSGRGTFLAGEHIDEAYLRDADVFELGRGGPRLVVGLQGRRAPLPRLLSGLGRASPGFRWSLAALAICGALLFGFAYRESQRMLAELHALQAALRRAEAERQLFERRIEQERAQAGAEQLSMAGRIEESRQREEDLQRRLAQAAGTEEVGSLKTELSLTRERLVTLEGERAAGERIIKQYGDGVCLIQGSYAFYDAARRPLRYRLDEAGDRIRGEDGTPELDVEGTGRIHTIDYFGTGFLVDGRGLVLSNRHVAEPWWRDAAAEEWGKQGFAPRFVLFRAFFPRQRDAFTLDVARLAADSVDLALLRMDRVDRSIPVLPLARSGREAVAGQPVVLVGYPTGLEAILAKAEPNQVRQIVSAHGGTAERMTEALAQRGLIRPSTTQGHIGDITSTDIVFDAPTTQGGSGGPVFNRNGQVVAVEYAVLSQFGGNAFGVPIAYALALVNPPRATR